MKKNAPISYDFHGDTALSSPFKKFRKEDISIYVDLDTKIGKGTCEQACSHCWFVNYEKVKNKAFEIEEGIALIESLQTEGYKIYPRYTDSFAYDGLFMEKFGSVHNREFRQGEAHDITKTMEGGDAWTSGAPLLKSNWIELLDKARVNGFLTISITFHGVINNSLEIESEYPIRGVFHGEKCVEVINRIKQYNQQNADKFGGFRINIGITVGSHNKSFEAINNYALYFNKIGVSVVRFNKFLDHGERNPKLALHWSDTKEIYKHIKNIHSNVSLDFQLGVSEDFGTYGIEVLELPQHVGWCQAGKRLFAITPLEKEVLMTQLGNTKISYIGEVVGCVNAFSPVLGMVYKKECSSSNKITYEVEFDVTAIEEFSQKRVDKHYSNGCFAGELLQEQKGTINIVELQEAE